MTPLVATAVLIAALTHASWNAIAHNISDKLAVFSLIGGGSAAIGVVLAFLTPFPDAAAWPYLVASGVLHVSYMLLLMRSFQLGDFGQMYPIARGTAPLVVTVAAAVFVGESLDSWQTAGVAVASAGLVGLAVWGIRGSGKGGNGGNGGNGGDSSRTASRWPALLAAVATGLSIAAYTVVDGVGVRSAGSPLSYIAWLMILQGGLIPIYALLTRRGRLLPQLRRHAGLGLLGAALSMLSYGLVLWAQTRAALAPVSALRESSIIVGAAIGTIFFKERFGVPRMVAAGLMVVGIGLMLHAG
ncbi:EamA family transporter [Streptomyces paludis]|uniref:EamA family transporter n=1 Tax=Streptomyces paludis TaxID=2282738 RepID=A0A345HSH7_9ACTN|nr:EamA family transporter [Streptomyces paludis]AXG79651.1 EamA family transporter [Streptomyces paludis]